VSAEQAENSEDTFVGRVVQDRFRVVRRLAAGGMGVVYEAEQVPLGRKVALKLLEIQKGPSVSDQSFRERFFLEASAAAKLAHPNTIVVHDYGKTDDGLYFIAMEYLNGGTLSQRLKDEGPLPPQAAIHVGLQVASSLRDAHEQGLVHRDLKPGNVMFAPRGGDPLFVKVLDFGLVKVVSGDEKDRLQLTQSGVMMGSPRYMAPEQVKAAPCDGRTDIYSFGAVLYHALCGAPPFHVGSTFEAMQAHVYQPPPPFHQTWAGCPAGPMLERVVLKCLEKEPDFRYQSMDEVMAALREAAAVEAGGSLAGVGSYLTGSSGSQPGVSDSRPDALPPAPVAGSDSGPQGASGIVSRAQPAPSMVQSGATTNPTAGRVVKTMKFEPGATPPGAAPPAASQTGPVAPQSPYAPLPQTTSPMAHAGAPPKRGGGKLGLVLAALIALVLAGGVAVAVVVLAPSATPTPTAQAEPTPEPIPEPTPPPEPPPAAEPTPAPAEEHPVMHLQTDPPGATVRRDGSDLGDTPLDLRIPEGTRWTIEILMDGYESRTVTLLGGTERLTIHLESNAEEPAAGPRPRPHRPVVRPPQPVVRPLAPGPSPRPTTRRGRRTPEGLDDPWAR